MFYCTVYATTFDSATLSDWAVMREFSLAKAFASSHQSNPRFHAQTLMHTGVNILEATLLQRQAAAPPP